MCWFLHCRFYLLRGLLPNIWNWTLPAVVSHPWCRLFHSTLLWISCRIILKGPTMNGTVTNSLKNKERRCYLSRNFISWQYPNCINSFIQNGLRIGSRPQTYNSSHLSSIFMEKKCISNKIEYPSIRMVSCSLLLTSVFLQYQSGH